MGRPIRYFIPGLVYEITSRTFQERFLLRPSANVRDVIVGILERGRQLYGVRIHGFFYLSNHSHLMISADSAEQLSGFIGYVNGLVSKKVGRMNGWRGHFWARRATIIPILDDVALVRRMKYLMAQGVKEGLVSSVLDWPGASSNPALLGDMTLRGVWVDQDGLRAARRARPSTSAKEFTAHLVLQLTPLPCWADLSPDRVRAKHQQLADEIECEARETRKGAPVLGVAAVLAQNPLTQPIESEHSIAPACHTVSEWIRERFARLYSAVVAAYRDAAAKMQSFVQRSFSTPIDRAAPRFPAGTIPRARWTVPPDPRALTDVVLDLGLGWRSGPPLA